MFSLFCPEIQTTSSISNIILTSGVYNIDLIPVIHLINRSQNTVIFAYDKIDTDVETTDKQDYIGYLALSSITHATIVKC